MMERAHRSTEEGKSMVCLSYFKLDHNPDQLVFGHKKAQKPQKERCRTANIRSSLSSPFVISAPFVAKK